MSTEELSLVVTGLAVVVAPAVAYAVAKGGFRHDRKLADLEDARSSLATAANELWRMKQAMRDEFATLSESLRTGDWPADLKTRIGKLEGRRDAVEGQLDVLRLRFPAESEITGAYSAAWETVRGLLALYMSEAGGSGREEASEKAWELSQTFDDHRAQFLVAAQLTVGLELPAPGTGKGSARKSPT